ncbi:Tetratricopeptide repeat 1 [Dillenia turbinata]|uniref:Tetratricopeptide repeat 1 n=1 Tax=Dillenia turbinata TaxID=194707 RepID=A0AAN8ZMY1_9MAGN
MGKSKLKTDSPLSRRIVLSFLNFLDSLEPAPGVDLEGLEVVRECLTEVFKIDQSAGGAQTDPDVLVNLFSSLEGSGQHEIKSDVDSGEASIDGLNKSSVSVHDTAEVASSEYTKSLDDDHHNILGSSGLSKDELCGQFFAALEKIHYFRAMPDGQDDQAQLDKATCLFHDALSEMERSNCEMFDRSKLAETLKSQGNRAMQSKLYSDAIELYTCAIALCENNAVYYCNRAAAYTQIHKYAEAISDCHKSIDIDPNYSKAYSRLGIAYYAQGRYRDAINEGFLKALRLDPNNDAVKENLQAAEKKLKEEQQQASRDRATGSTGHASQDSNNESGRTGPRAPPSPFASFNASGLPEDFANFLRNIAGNASYQGANTRNHPEGSRNGNGFEEPQINIGANFDVNFGEEMPPELAGTLRSVMEMFNRGASSTHDHSQDNMNGRSAS